jgi:hypothetical protein
MKKKPRIRIIAGQLAALTLAITTGCTHLGPKTVSVDRADYSMAIAESWKQQTLLNIVKLRYNDLPVLLDVGSVVSAYSIQTGVSVNGTLSADRAVQANYASIGGSALYTDRPTITYVPMTGDKLRRILITAIEPRNVFTLIQTGYDAEFTLSLAVESLNGVRNRSTAGLIVREADPEFVRALTLLREVQAAGVFGMQVEEDKTNKSSTGIIFFRRDNIPPDIAEKAAEIRRLLKMSPHQEKFVLTYAPARGATNELAVNSRSMLQIMQALASRADVPEAHLKAHKSWAVPLGSTQQAPLQNLRIFSGKQKPVGAFAAVQYRGYWFWIDDDDQNTKRALTVIVLIFTLAETGEAEKLPTVTIPAQ